MFSKKRVVVTGGAGFLGCHVVRHLLLNNNSVVVLDDFSNGKMSNLDSLKHNPDLKILRGDITKEKDVKKAFKGMDIIIHLAVLGLRQSIKEPVRVNHVIINGTLNCLNQALENDVDLFVNCSSSEAYGTAQHIPMGESHPLRPETPYAAGKVAQDMYVSSYGRTYGLPWLTVRPFNMYGPNSHWQGMRGELIPKMIVRAMNRKPLIVFGDGSQTRDFIYVEDAARSLLEIAEIPGCRGQVINICSGKETKILRIAELISESFSLDKKEFIKKQPPRPGDVKRHLGDNSKLKALIHNKDFVSIQEGIKRTVEWFQSLPVEPDVLLSQEKIRSWE